MHSPSVKWGPVTQRLHAWIVWVINILVGTVSSHSSFSVSGIPWAFSHPDISRRAFGGEGILVVHGQQVIRKASFKEIKATQRISYQKAGLRSHVSRHCTTADPEQDSRGQSTGAKWHLEKWLYNHLRAPRSYSGVRGWLGPHEVVEWISYYHHEKKAG